jgi:hypothetical protein
MTDLRTSGLVRETRGTNGSMVYRAQTADKMFQYTAPKHPDAAALERSRSYACSDLERQMGEAGVTVADLIPSTDNRGVNLK